jgi:hypothetical protein
MATARDVSRGRPKSSITLKAWKKKKTDLAGNSRISIRQFPASSGFL